MALITHQFPCLSDNYGFLLHDEDSGETVAIDTPDAAAYLAEAAKHGWTITQIWNTHWHPDHAGGNKEIKEASGCHITAPKGEGDKITCYDSQIEPGTSFAFAGHDVHVLDVSGHTMGHIAYHIPSAHIAFVGDSIFALGCGRMFEGTPDMMWSTMLRLRGLPFTADIEEAGMKSHRDGKAREDEVGRVVKRVAERVVIAQCATDHQAKRLDRINADGQHDEACKEQGHQHIEYRDDNDLNPGG